MSGRVPVYAYNDGDQYGEMMELGYWICPDCGFAFSADHANSESANRTDRTYSCPCCELIAADKELAETRRVHLAEWAEFAELLNALTAAIARALRKGDKVSLPLNNWKRIAAAYLAAAAVGNHTPKRTPKPYEADPAFDEEYANMEARHD